MKTNTIVSGVLLSTLLSANAFAVTSAEIFTTDAYQYGRFSARIQFAPGSGVVSSFFLWKDGSEVDGTFWNELDFEKLEDECFVETNTIYGNPVGLHSERHDLAFDLCGSYHVYTYEWTPTYLSWEVDGVEIRRETGDVVQAYAQNTAAGMQLRFNVWPGDETFGGVFNPSILPVYQYIDWIEYASFSNGSFEVQWRDDFNEATLPARWSTANWESPKMLSTHAASNVAVKDGYVVLALTADNATGTAGASPAVTDTETDPTGTSSDSSATTSEPGTTSAPSETSAGTSTETNGSEGETSSGDISTAAPSTSDNDASNTTTAAPSGESTQATTAPTTTAGVAPANSSASQTTSASVPTSPPAATTDTTTSAGAPVVDATADDTGCGCKVGAQKRGNFGWVTMGAALFVAIGLRARTRVSARRT